MKENFKVIDGLVRDTVYHILPQVYEDSLSYSELLNQVTFRMNELIGNNNKLPDFIIVLIQEYISSGAIGEVVQNVLSDYMLNVKNPPMGLKGAVGDGSEDDTEAIQGCIDYASENGGKAIYFPSGRYLTKGLTLKDNVAIVGFDRYSTKIVMRGGSLKPLLGGACNNVTINRITLDGNMDIQTENLNLIDISGGNYLINDVELTDGYDLLKVNLSGNMQLENVVFKHGVENAIVLSGAGKVIGNNLMFNSLSDLLGKHIIDNSVAGVLFDNLYSECKVDVAINNTADNSSFTGQLINNANNISDSGNNTYYNFYGKGSNLEKAISNEVIARIDADDVLQGLIDAEALTRTEEDVLLQDNINAETLARIEADNSLQANIEAEALVRIEADSLLQADIEAETLARIEADKEISSKLAGNIYYLNYKSGSVSEYIQSVIDIVPENTIIEFERNKIYTLDANIQLKNHIHLCGSGATVKNAILLLDNCTDIEIYNFKFDGDNTTSTLYTPIRTNGNTSDIEIHHNIFKSCEVHIKSYLTTGENNNINVHHNKFIGDQLLKSAEFGLIYFANTKNSSIYHNYIDVTNAYRFVKLATGINCFVSVGSTHKIVKDSYCENISIKDNKFFGTLKQYPGQLYAKQAIDMYNGTVGVEIKDNEFEVNLTNGIPVAQVIDGKAYGSDDGIQSYTNKVKDITIKGNRIKGNFYKAVSLGNLYGQSILHDNVGKIYNDTDSYVLIEDNKIICTNTDETPYDTFLIHVRSHFQVDIFNNTMSMVKEKSIASKSIWIEACGYINIKNNKLLKQSKVYIKEPEEINGAPLLDSIERENCIKSINVEGNVFEYTLGRALALTGINTFKPIDGGAIKTKCTIINNTFYNKDSGTLQLPLGTGGKFNFLEVRGNSYATDGTGTLTYPNYSNMCSFPIFDEDNSWSGVTNVPTANTWIRGQKLWLKEPAPSGYVGLVCTLTGTHGTLSGITGSIASGSRELTLNSIAGLSAGCYINIAGVSGVRRILTLDTKTKIATLHSVSSVADNAEITFQNPIWKGFGMVESEV